MTQAEKQKLVLRTVMMEMPFLILGAIGYFTTGQMWMLIVGIVLGMLLWVPVIPKLMNTKEQG